MNQKNTWMENVQMQNVQSYKCKMQKRKNSIALPGRNEKMLI